MSRNVAEAVVSTLAEARVEVVFGLPGVHNLALFDALERSPIRVIVVRHESTAAYAADAVGRLTGRPGICLTTSGPGAANTVAAMGEAQASSSPVLHLTTTVARRHLGFERSRGVLHEHPRQLEIFLPVTKLARQADRAEAVASTVHEAFEVAATAPRSPTYVQVPTDLLEAEDPGHHPGGEGARSIEAPVPPRDDLRELSGALADSERPAIWVGSGAAHAGAEIAGLAERLHAPIVLTHSAKRRWSASPHGLVLTNPPHEPAVAEMLARSDTVLVLGSDLDGMMTQDFRLPLEPILRIDVDPQRASGDDERYPSIRAAVGDAAAGVKGLLDLIPVRDGGWGYRAAPEADSEARQTLEREPDASGGLTFVDALDRALGSERVTVLCDMAISGYWVGGYLPLVEGRRITYPMGWGTLGSALPSSIGAACVGSGKAVVICGDGGVLFSIGELATIAQEKLDVTVVVQNDFAYGALRYDEERRYGRSFAVDLAAPDFVAMASSYGLRAERVGVGDAELSDVLERSVAEHGPRLVEVTGSLSPPRVTSGRWPLASGVTAGESGGSYSSRTVPTRIERPE